MKKSNRIIIDGKYECLECHQILPADSFYKSGDGVQSYCKDCCSKRNKAWRDRNALPVKKDLEGLLPSLDVDDANRTLASIAKYLKKLGYFEVLCNEEGVFNLDYLKKCVFKEKGIGIPKALREVEEIDVKTCEKGVESSIEEQRSFDSIESVLSRLRNGGFNFNLNIGFNERED